MNLPPFVYSKAFWTGLSYLGAGLLALLVYFGVIGPEWALSAGALLALFLTVLSWFGITPELRLKALQTKYELLLEAHRQLLEEKGMKMDKKSKR